MAKIKIISTDQLNRGSREYTTRAEHYGDTFIVVKYKNRRPTCKLAPLTEEEREMYQRLAKRTRKRKTA